MTAQNASSFPEHIALPSCALVPLTPRDAGRISRELAQMEPWRTLGYRAEGLFHYLTSPDPTLHCYEITCGDDMAGIFCVRSPWLLGSFVELLALFDGFRSKGLGGEIMDWMQANTPSRNLWATVSSFNTQARRFYHRRGFSEIAVLDDLVKPGFDEILLRKRLG